jgi:dynein heavy chain
MALLRCFRPDCLFLAARKSVQDNMEEKYTKFSIVNYNSLFDQSTPTAPVLFILSIGADPVSILFKLAEKLGLTADELAPGRTNRIRQIALDKIKKSQLVKCSRQELIDGIG